MYFVWGKGHLCVGFIFFVEGQSHSPFPLISMHFVYFEMDAKSDLIETRIDLLCSKEILCPAASDLSQ